MNDKPDLDTASTSLAQTVTRRLVLWVIRWVIGFTVIAVAVSFWPALSWLWWGGGAFAALSLAVTLAIHFLMQRKILAVQEKTDDMERLWAEIGEGDQDSDDET